MAFKIQPGDMLRRRKAPGLFWHDGMFVGWDRVGTPLVFENNVGVDAQIIPFDLFAKGQPVEHIPYQGPFSRLEVVECVQSLIGETRYDLLNFNCEHAVSLCQTGVARSNQVVVATLAALTALFAFLLSWQRS